MNIGRKAVKTISRAWQRTVTMSSTAAVLAYTALHQTLPGCSQSWIGGVYDFDPSILNFWLPIDAGEHQELFSVVYSMISSPGSSGRFQTPGHKKQSWLKSVGRKTWRYEYGRETLTWKEEGVMTGVGRREQKAGVRRNRVHYTQVWNCQRTSLTNKVNRQALAIKTYIEQRMETFNTQGNQRE